MSIIDGLDDDQVFDELSDHDGDDIDETISENAIISQRKIIKKRSSVWPYFDQVEENGVRYAICKLCVDKTTKYLMSGKSGSGTGNLQRHLNKNHSDEIVAGALRLTNDNNTGVFVFSQENFRKALIKWIVLCDQPFTEPQQQSFVELVHSLNPNAELITDKTVRADIVETYTEKFEDLKVLLSQIPGKLSVSLDGWTSRNVLPFLAIRGHWLDADWNYNSVLLDFSYIVGKHSGWKHSCIFRDSLTRLNIETTKILGVTGDNAGSNDTFFDWMEEYGLTAILNKMRCICHIFNLAVKDLLELLRVPAPEDDDVDAEDHDFENETLEDIDINEELIPDDDEPTSGTEPQTDDTHIIAKLRKIVKKIRKTVKLRQKLKKCCLIYDIPYRVPIIDVLTRWNSTYHMIVRAKELRAALRFLYQHENSLLSLQLTDEEWRYLDVVEKLLQKFDRATKLMSMERHSTIHSYIPTLDWMIDSVDEFAKKNTGALRAAALGGLQKLKKYEVAVDKCIIPFIATILHPALKLNYFKEHGYSTSEIREIKKAVSDYFTTNYEAVANEIDCQSSSEDELHAHMFKRSRKERTSKEFEKYLNLPLAPRKIDPLVYWKSHADEFTCMSMMARDIFAVQSASTSVERDFSKGSRFVTPTRCKMSQTTIRATMSLKSWYSIE